MTKISQVICRRTRKDAPPMAPRSRTFRRSLVSKTGDKCSHTSSFGVLYWVNFVIVCQLSRLFSCVTWENLEAARPSRCLVICCALVSTNTVRLPLLLKCVH